MRYSASQGAQSEGTAQYFFCIALKLVRREAASRVCPWMALKHVYMLIHANWSRPGKVKRENCEAQKNMRIKISLRMVLQY